MNQIPVSTHRASNNKSNFENYSGIPTETGYKYRKPATFSDKRKSDLPRCGCIFAMPNICLASSAAIPLASASCRPFRQRQNSKSLLALKPQFGIILKIAAITVITCFTGIATVGAQGTASFTFPQNSHMDSYSWLRQNGFVLKNGAADITQFKLFFSPDGLVVQAVKPALGLIVKDNLKIDNFKKIIIKWGVSNYPTGANWDKGIHNEPLMVYVFFGDQLYSSDSWFIPNSPPFIGFYLGKHDKVGGCHIGRHFTKGGRYVCVANPPPTQTITSEIDLVAEFKKAFGNSIPMPSFISGISIESDTSDLAGTCLSSAFVQSIEITN